jgi:CheY-like chemotaxis protein
MHHDNVTYDNARRADPLIGLAHDLRNAVGTICSSLEVLRQDPASDAGARARACVDRQASQLIRLANRIQDAIRVAVAADADCLPATAETASAIRVLVVDDDNDAATSLATLLKLWEYEVLVSHDGASAVRMALDFRPDVCLIDIWMPGLSGYQVAELLRREPSLQGTLLIALSGYDQLDDRRLARAAGFDQHLFKPVEIAALRALLEGRHAALEPERS